MLIETRAKELLHMTMHSASVVARGVRGSGYALALVSEYTEAALKSGGNGQRRRRGEQWEGVGSAGVEQASAANSDRASAQEGNDRRL